ncbi:MAG: hypothetical protein OXB99_07095 [Acidimicrobiaceae bacterium]|nr:hypothetical protein [Acidimicrobiaceae bacterium]
MPLTPKPRLKTFLTVYPINERTWGVRGGDGEFWSLRLQDKDAVRCLGVVLPFLNGSTPQAQVLEAVDKAGLDPNAGAELLDKLEAAGLIENADDAGLTSAQLDSYRDQIKLFSRFTSDGGAKYQALLLRSRIAVAGASSLAGALCGSLATAGLGQVTALLPRDHQQSDVTGATEVLQLDRESILPPHCLDPLPKALVVAQTAHDPELLEAVDAFSKTHRVPWLLVRLIDQMEGWVGPLFVPGDTASYVSFEGRLRVNMAHYDLYVAFDQHARTLDGGATDVGSLRPFASTLAGVAVTELVKHVTGLAVPALAGRFLSVNLWTLDTEIHEVLKLPRLENDAYSRPGVFPWKDVPYGSTKTRRA